MLPWPGRLSLLSQFVVMAPHDADPVQTLNPKPLKSPLHLSTLHSVLLIAPVTVGSHLIDVLGYGCSPELGAMLSRAAGGALSPWLTSEGPALSTGPDVGQTTDKHFLSERMHACMSLILVHII